MQANPLPGEATAGPKQSFIVYFAQPGNRTTYGQAVHATNVHEAFRLIKAKHPGARPITWEYEQASQGSLIKSESLMLDNVLN